MGERRAGPPTVARWGLPMGRGEDTERNLEKLRQGRNQTYKYLERGK